MKTPDFVLSEWQARGLIHTHCQSPVELVTGDRIPLIRVGCKECFRLLQQNFRHLEASSGHSKLNMAVQAVKP